MAPTSSSSEIHGNHWSPLPSRPPRPNLNSGSCLASAPPPWSSTTAERRWATRMPASLADDVDASQASTTSARKPLPDGLASVCT